MDAKKPRRTADRILEVTLDELLQTADNMAHVEDAWLFFHMMFEQVWQYRFLYRDLNDLLSRNRRLEMHFQSVLQKKSRAGEAVLDGINRGGQAPRSARPGLGGHVDGGGAHPLAQLRIRARAPQGAVARSRRRHAGARCVARAEPADALPGTRRARAPQGDGRRLQVLTRSPTSHETTPWPNGTPSPTTPPSTRMTPRR